MSTQMNEIIRGRGRNQKPTDDHEDTEPTAVELLDQMQTVLSQLVELLAPKAEAKES